MSVFSAPDFQNHELVAFGADAETGLRCIVAVHSTALGPALGGCRMWAYASDDDALKDALRLAHGMTYKAAIAGLPYGGGKAVILGDAKNRKSPALMRAFGRFIDQLGGRYITAEDVGTTVADMDAIARETKHVRGVSGGSGNPSPMTALGVYMAMQAAVEHKLGRRSLAGLKVAVQGLGSVGYGLCRHLADAGARLFVTDINEAAVTRAVQEFRATAVAPGAIFAVEADVFAPCALGAVLNDDTIPQLAVAIVTGAANNQLGQARHGAMLKDRGVLYVPDYVANAGGVINVAHDGPGYDRAAVARKVEGIYDTVRYVLRRADAENAPTNVIADRIAAERVKARSTAVLAA